jgi:hypothetical protein
MNAAMPVRTLAFMTVSVVLAHVVVLQGTSVALSMNEPPITRPFITRTIQLAPPAPASVQAPAPAAPGKQAAHTRQAAPTAEIIKKPSNSEPNSSPDPVEYAQEAPKTVALETPPPPQVVAEAAPAPAPPEPQAPEALTAPKTFVMPGSTRLKYNVTGGKDSLTYHARAELLWLHDGKTYDARMEVSAFMVGSRVRTSTGRLTAQGLTPTRFSDKSRAELAAHFDHDKGRVTFSNGPEAPLLAGAQDQLSLFIQLGALLAGEPGKYPVGTTISTQTVGPRSAETWVVTVDSEEKLQLPGGDLTTVKLVRNPRREYDQKAEMWLAPSLGYLPVRLRITQPNGDYVDQQWRATEAP